MLIQNGPYKHTDYEQSAMTQANLLTSLDLNLTKNRRGFGAAGEKSGDRVHEIMAEARAWRD